MIQLKTTFLCVILFAVGINTNAQIGINTDSPLSYSILHVDAATNNGNGINSDDVLIDIQGNVGIGTVIPTAKLDVRGNFRMNDGSAQIQYVLTSDVSGTATWKDVNSNRLGIWSIEKNTSTIISTTESLLTGTTSLSQNDIGLVSGTNSVTVLPGKYLIFFDGNIEANEFGYLIVKDALGNVLNRIFYSDALSGSSVILSFSEPTTLRLWYQHIQTNITGINYTASTASSYTTAKYYYNLTFLQLK